MTTQPAWRYAVYFAPAQDHALWRAGCDWLGRDARAGQPHGSAPPGRHSPWRYGLHATLKAPLRLRAGTSEASWLHAVADVAAAHRPFMLPPLRVGLLTDFVALRPTAEPNGDAPLRRLADDCVEQLDPWRAPLADAKRAKRLRSIDPQDDEQRGAIDRWGYPHVFAHWRFHITLSDALPAEDARQRMLEHASAHFEDALAEPLACDALSVFVERAPGDPFELAWRFPLHGR